MGRVEDHRCGEHLLALLRHLGRQAHEKPELPAVIEIDGASPGMGIMHRLGEVDPKKIRIGMKVKAVWKPAAEREGSITDIKYWKPY